MTDFDAFMIELDREVELTARRHAGRDGQALQDEMIRSLELGAASIPSEDVARCVETLAGSLKNAGIEWIAYVEDLAAPGGTGDMATAGRHRSRYNAASTRVDDRPERKPACNRRAVVQPDVHVPAGSKVAVVDAAAFSGTTIRMATDALISRFTQIDVVPAVLVASQSLADRSHNGERWLDRLVYTRVTGRPDITFPWVPSS